ncbi:hypothetical protein CsatB_002255 [Cannabis sativa]
MIISEVMKYCYQLLINFVRKTFAGKDATNDFEDVGHSDSAREMMEKYYIREIDATTIPLTKTDLHSTARNSTQSQ